jgi:bifunctional non-homologous end joining protein LigD
MKTIDKPSHFRVGDAGELLKRAWSKALFGWGRADQVLPSLQKP